MDQLKNIEMPLVIDFEGISIDLIIRLLGTHMNQKLELMEILQGEDDLGVVVRSHIVVEQYLNHLIETVMANPECYQSIKIDSY